MKRISYLLSLLLLMSLTLFTACKDDEGGDGTETPEQIKTRQLTDGPFTVSTVTKGGEAVTLDGPVTITFNSNGTYAINGVLPSPHGTTMPATGTWSFKDTQNFGIVLNGGSDTVELTSVNIADNSLSFTYQGAGLKASDPAVPVVVNATR